MTLPWKALAKKYFQERQRLLEALRGPHSYVDFSDEPVESLSDKEFWERIEKELPPAPTTEPHLTHTDMLKQIEQQLTAEAALKIQGPK